MSTVLRALIVDDSRFSRKVIRIALQNIALANWEFEDAETGIEAIRYLKEFEYDLVVTDVNMPELDGQGLLRYIRKNSAWNDMPVIVVSSLGSGSALPDLAQHGATTVLSKPISRPDAMARLAEIVAEIL